MSFDAERAAIQKRLVDNWDAVTTPIQFDGVPFQTPQDTAYIAMWILRASGQQISIETNPLHRYIGIISFKVLTPANQGSSPAMKLVDSIDSIFRRQTFSYGASGVIVCRVGTPTWVGARANWYQANYTIPYRRDIKYP